jgi:MFS family permease
MSRLAKLGAASVGLTCAVDRGERCRRRPSGGRRFGPAPHSRSEIEPANAAPAPGARSIRALLDLLRNPSLRLLALAWGSSMTAEGTYLVVLGVYAYGAGGAWAVGLVGLVRMLPAAASASLGSLLADRFAREQVLRAVEAMRTALLAGVAVAAFAGAPATPVFVLAAVHAVVSGLLRPSLKSVLPSIARTPGQLVAANAASSTMESLGMLGGAALGGVLVATAGAGVGFAVASAFCLLASVLVVTLRVEGGVLHTMAPGRSLADVLAGLRTLAAANPAARLITGLFAAQTFVRGALSVLIIVVAVDLLELDQSWIGLLTAALGAGGVLGALAAAGLAGRPLATPLLLGLVLWGAPLAAIGTCPSAPVALAAFATVGAGNAILDVTGNTLLQRLVPSDVLGRVFGAFTGLALATAGVGCIVAPALIETLGSRGTLFALGALLPSLALLAASRVRAIDRAAIPPERTLGLLRQVPMFASLSVAAAEQVASRLIPLDITAEQVVIREGDEGHRFYIVEEGELEVTHAGRSINLCRTGNYVGEIALLRDVRRTATVTACRDSRVHALERADFLAAVAGHPAGVADGRVVVKERLDALTDNGHGPPPAQTPSIRHDARASLLPDNQPPRLARADQQDDQVPRNGSTRGHSPIGSYWRTPTMPDFHPRERGARFRVRRAFECGRGWAADARAGRDAGALCRDLPTAGISARSSSRRRTTPSPG